MIITIPVRALPLNMIYSQTKTGRRVKSKKYKVFSAKVRSVLPLYNARLLEFKNSFNIDKHYIRCNWVFKHNILTTSGRISMNSGDSSNMIKPTEDLIFKYMGINDAFVKGGTFDKVQSNKEEIYVEMSIFNL